MTPPVAACQCTSNLAIPCGNAITQEDLLCDLCRACQGTPNATCLGVMLPSGRPFHLGMLEPTITIGPEPAWRWQWQQTAMG